jgi:hypothetical protein
MPFVPVCPRALTCGASLSLFFFGVLSAARTAQKGKSRRGFRGSSSGRRRNEGGVADAHAWPAVARRCACARRRLSNAQCGRARTGAARLIRHGSAAELVSAKRAMCRDRQTRVAQSQSHDMQLDDTDAHRMRDQWDASSSCTGTHCAKGRLLLSDLRHVEDCNGDTRRSAMSSCTCHRLCACAR